MEATKSDLKPTAVRFSLSGTILIISGKPFILKEDKGELESIYLSEENFTDFLRIYDDKKSALINNKDGRLDME